MGSRELAFWALFGRWLCFFLEHSLKHMTCYWSVSGNTPCFEVPRTTSCNLKMAFMTLETMESPWAPPHVHSHPPALPAGPMEVSMSVLACGASQHPAVTVHCLHTVSKKDAAGEDDVSILKWDRKQGRGHLSPSKVNDVTSTHVWVGGFPWSLFHQDVLSWKSATAW